MIQYKDGDVVEAAKNKEIDILIHGCNCFNTMGSGVAKAIGAEWPQAYEEDCTTIKGSKSKLGSFSFVEIPNGPTIINAYTQFNYNRKNEHIDLFEYAAFEKILNKIAYLYLPNKFNRIGMPKIGSGLAGGSWNKIEKIIQNTLKDFDVTIYELRV